MVKDQTIYRNRNIVVKSAIHGFASVFCQKLQIQNFVKRYFTKCQFLNN